jgi:hypothetical protein
MNEVNMKYWFSDFKKKKKYRFSGLIRTFHRRKTGFYEKNRFLRKKNFRRSAVCHRRLPWFHGCPYKNFVRPIFERCFQVRDFCFRITEGIGLTGVSFHFWPQKQIPSDRNFWLLFHFHVKNLPIFMFLGLIWCKILC